MNEKAKLAAKALAQKPAPEPILNDKDFLSWGLTLVNLGCYGRTDRGVAKGSIYRLAGRASSGKTFVCRTVLAEAAMNPNFAEYELCYDDVERGAVFIDTRKFFGQKLALRMTSPAIAKGGKRLFSRTTSDFFTRLRKRLDAGKKVIWIEDSLDALDVDKDSKAGDGKARIYSQGLRRIMDPLTATGSILILICQARANLNPGFVKFGQQIEDITSGGRALEHYPSIEIWLRKARTIRNSYKGMKFEIGSIISAKIKKNRMSGKNCTVYFPFYPKSGLDDVGSCVDFLLQVKHWKTESEEESKIITAMEFEFVGTPEELIQHIYREGAERELQILTGKIWHEIDKVVSVQRKVKYT